MNIFKFLKKRKITKQENKKITLKEIPDWIEKKREEIKKREENLFNLIKEKILITLKELKEKIENLRKIKLESKKTEERIKEIVKENKENYIHQVEEFLERLTNLNKKDINEFVKEINKIFGDFEKKSYASYQKANFLIGKEITTIKKEIIIFSNSLKEIFDKEKFVIDSIKRLETLEKNLEKIKEIIKLKKELENKKEIIEKKIETIVKNKEKIEQEINLTKQDKEYLQYLKEKDELKKTKEKLIKEIDTLKEMIDFKKMGNILHSNQKEMEILKQYRENFQSKFKENLEKDIFSLIKECKEDNKNIINQQEKIKKIKETIEAKRKEMKEDKIQKLTLEIEEKDIKIKELNDEKENLTKRNIKLEINKKEIIDSLKRIFLKENIIFKL